MSFTSVEFIGFLAAVVILYYALPKKCQWVFLLLASYGFYMAGGVKTVVYLLFTTLSTFAAGLWLGRLNDRKDALTGPEKKAQAPVFKRKKQMVTALVLIANFGLLFALKYWNFTASAVFGATGGSVNLPQLNLLMPLGISFYMFQSVGYVVDCYRGKYKPQRNVFKYALFTSFFPQVVQGPISRYDQLSPQLLAEHPFNADHLKYGIQLCMWGYFKKLVIADRAAVLVNTVFGDYTSYSGSIIALAVFFYCIQLYCDFSGGIDVTRGAAQMLGIDLAENFRRPLFATSLADYWRRWHITLGQWMRDYVFFSLTLSKPILKLGKWSRKKIGGTLGKVIPTATATFVVYLFIGIWHGANFRYIFYGLWNGAIITSSQLLANTYYRCRTKLKLEDDNRGLYVFRMVRTWILVFLGRYITRAPRLMAAFYMMWVTVSRPVLSDLWNGTALTLGIARVDYVIVLGAMAIVVAAEFFQERGTEIRKWLEQRGFLVQWLAIFLPLLILLVTGILRGDYISSEFIYKQF